MRIEETPSIPGRGPVLAAKYAGAEIGYLSTEDLVDLFLHHARLPGALLREVRRELARRLDTKNRSDRTPLRNLELI